MLLALFCRQAFVFGFKPRRIVAFIGNAVPSVEFKNPTRGIVQEVSIVGNGDHGAWELGEKLFKPADTFCIKVVGGFI